MRAILSQRPLRFVFAANMVSMLGSGMNAAAVAWYILQATHSEVSLGTLTVLQTIPAMLMHFVKAVKTPTLVLVGDRDGEVPMASGSSLRRLARQRSGLVAHADQEPGDRPTTRAAIAP